MSGDINTRYGNFQTNIKPGQLHKKTLVLDGKETITGSSNSEKFVSSGNEKSGTEIFDIGKKFKAEVTGQEIKTGEVTGETKTEGAKPKNLQKLEGLTEKYKHLSGISMAGMAGLGAIGGIAVGMAGGALGIGSSALGAAAGALIGAAIGGPIDGHYEHSEITKSGVEKKSIQDRHNGAADYTTDYNLPDGTQIHKEYHSKPKENKYKRIDMASPQSLASFISGGPKDISESLSAVDKEGHKLDAKVVKDEKTGSERIQVSNSNGTITMLDPSTLGFTVATQTSNSKISDFQQKNTFGEIADFLKLPAVELGNKGESIPRETENTPMVETVNPDGSIELILNESSISLKHRAEDPLHTGKTIEEKAPEYHSYTKVNISPEGDTKVEKVEENYNVKVKDGHLVSKRTKFADALNSLTQGSLATSLNTEGDFTISNTSKPGIFEKMDPLGSHMNRLLDNKEVKPFVTRSQMKEAHNNLVEKRIEDARKDLMQNPTSGWSTGPTGWTVYIPPEAETGNSSKPGLMEAKGPDGTIYMATADGTLRALTPEGEKKWSFDKSFHNGITATPLPDKDNLYVLDKQNTLHCLKSGSYSALDVWDTDIKGEIIGDPSIDKNGNINIPVKIEEKVVQRTINPKNGMEVKARIVHI